MLINQKNTRNYALAIARGSRPRFTRVSKEFLVKCDATLRNFIESYLKMIPSVGKTI